MDPINIKISSHKTCLMIDNPQLFSLQLFQIRGVEWFLLILTDEFGVVEG